MRPSKALLSVPLIAATLLAGCSSGAGPKSSARGTTSTTATSTSTTTSSTTTTAPAGPAGGPVPSGFSPESVTYVSSTQAWVLGTAPCSTAPCTSLVRTRDGGASWKGVAAPSVVPAADPTGTSGVSRVRFADPRDGWIFGPGLYSTHDGGSSWTSVTVPGAPSGARVVSLAAGNGYAYLLVVPAQGAAGAGEVFRTGVGSDNWAPAGLTVAGADNGLVLVQGSSVWAVVVTTQGQTVLEGQSGGGWRKQAVPCSTPTLAWWAQSSSELAAVCGSGGAAGQEVKEVYTSTDGGASFSRAGAAPPGGDVGGLALASPTTMVVSAASGASWLYASFDGGASWSTVFTDSGSGGMPWYDLGFTTASVGEVIEGDPGVRGLPSSRMLVTHDGGHTWAPQTF
ncbi:MAG TPA: hypothetical protein VE990_09190 [Acidimicrobiales bacterium]|nr:hypothetical protein [Acidimicrobiales bacterium]